MQINTQRLMADFIVQLSNKLDILCRNMEEQMIGTVGSLPESGSHSSTGATDWRMDVIDSIKVKYLDEGLKLIRQVGLITNKELTFNRGMLINYGMGRTLATDNPYLDEYRGTEYFDADREGDRVFTRPGEDVYDYETGTWYNSDAKSRYEIEPFFQEPSYFFDSAYKEMEHEFALMVQSVFDNLDITQYLE